jgi:hypothetical protein
MTDPTELADLITRGAEVIETNGWIQTNFWPGALQDQNYNEGPVCAMGGILVAAGVREAAAFSWPDSAHDAFRAVQARLNENLFSWNDRNERTKGEVVALLRRTADELRGANPAES